MDCMLIAQSFSWTTVESWWAIAQVLIGLGFVIFVHELGHFLVAKACGVKCEKFYVGFDFFDIRIGDLVLIPRSLVKFQWGETEYGVGILPLGGYVKMLGQDDNPGNMEQEIERSKAAGSEEAGVLTEQVGPVNRDQLDPRSFMAKTVLQRMAIISAGVVFNLFFAVIFAAIAFKSGVNYAPPIVGEVTPGGPAWEANLYGAQFTKVGESNVEGYYRFIDLAQEIALSGADSPIPLEFTLPGSAEIKTARVTPRTGLNEQIDLALIGISPTTLPKIKAQAGALIEGHSAAAAVPPFETNDLIVEIDGERVDSVFDLKRILAKSFDKALDFVVARQRGESVENITIKVGANPQRETGLVMKWGKIVSIQEDSPASESKLLVGDQIVAINGIEPGDLYTLEQRMVRWAQEQYEPVKLSISRDGQTMEIEIAPRVPDSFALIEPNQPIGINALGVAIQPTNVVAHSSIAGIATGDEVTKVEFLLDDPQQKSIFNSRSKQRVIDIAESKVGWETIIQLIQMLPVGFEFKVYAKNGSDMREGVAASKQSTEFFLPTRGVMLSMNELIYRSPNWADALKRGVWQTWWDSSRIFKFLGKLVKGQISPKNLGGPALIAVAATSEATQGTSRLLLFLTLLSANLAIVNFLPIPVLDGGHMLFLAYEGLFRQPPNEKVQIILTYAGLFLILGLMLYVILLDINRFTGGWF